MIDKSRRTIIFDFGNVLINLEHKRTFTEFKKVLGVDFSSGLPEKMEAVFHRYEKGEINTESFLWALQQYNPKAEIRDVIFAWNSILGELSQARFDLVSSLRETYNVAMLSNINEMHEKEIDKRLEKELGLIDFRSNYFDKVYYSHLIGLHKPDTKIYSFVHQDLNIEPSSILFIDDLEKNVLAARSVGWNAVVHDPKTDIINNMEKYIEKAFN